MNDRPRFHIVENPNYDQGQSTSVRAGLAALRPDADAAMILLCDQPYVSSDLINGLIDLFEREKALISLPTCGSIRGNPVIFSKKLFDELNQITGDKGGRGLINKYWNNASKLEVASVDIFKDIDTIEDIPHH